MAPSAREKRAWEEKKRQLQELKKRATAEQIKRELEEWEKQQLSELIWSSILQQEVKRYVA